MLFGQNQIFSCPLQEPFSRGYYNQWLQQPVIPLNVRVRLLLLGTNQEEPLQLEWPPGLCYRIQR
jgi:hypothetical protein